MSTKLSVVIITFNEEKNIKKCLDKLSFANEIIIVDSGSTDKTVIVCKKFGAKVFKKKFNGFGEQKRFAVEKASNNWVLSLDADEVLTDNLITEIKACLIDNDSSFGFYIKRKHIFMDRVFNYGNESKKEFLRLFDRRVANFNLKKVHEFVETNEQTKVLKNAFLHYSYDSLNSYINKLNHYTLLYAKTNVLKNKKYSIFEVILKTKFEFVKKYLLELNFMNGKEGLYWAIFSAFYTFTKCVKTNELYKLSK